MTFPSHQTYSQTQIRIHSKFLKTPFAMKLTMFTTLTVLTTAVFAAPQHEISQTKSRDLQARLDTTTYTGITPTTKTTLIAGVGITEPLDPATDSYAHVTAHFVVPTIQDKNPGVVSALIALDGTSTGRRILTGINIHVTGDGDTIYIQIQEWEPSPSFSFTANDSQAFPIHPGDGEPSPLNPLLCSWK
ncbi:hypothetical protein OCU04_010101 [Sclerotinia nivalis]|uniref:Uncharacterized protein n=1 Tax=Sclerotinia nivalis TaxID=352851 RepID=A0A9X0DGQ0_9HELO|nr:hypothetical protein OCU04_010101 [Sclerotinia nivalis]